MSQPRYGTASSINRDACALHATPVRLVNISDDALSVCVCVCVLGGGGGEGELLV